MVFLRFSLKLVNLPKGIFEFQPQFVQFVALVLFPTHFPLGLGPDRNLHIVSGFRLLHALVKIIYIII